jgi:hypothetical protein
MKRPPVKLTAFFNAGVKGRCPGHLILSLSKIPLFKRSTVTPDGVIADAFKRNGRPKFRWLFYCFTSTLPYGI